MSEIVAGGLDALETILADEEARRDAAWTTLQHAEEAMRPAQAAVNEQRARWHTAHEYCNRLRARITTLKDIHADAVNEDPFRDD